MSRHDLGVLETTRYVVDNARLVSIVASRMAEFCQHLRRTWAQPPRWEPSYHFNDGSARTLNYLLALDSINFCFWGDEPWEVEYQGRALTGYWALAAALTRAVEEGVPLLDAGTLANLDAQQLGHILRGRGQIPLFQERLHILREVGRGLARHYGGQFVQAVEQARGSGLALAQAVIEAFPSFRDVVHYQGREVRFYKRAQILVADIYGCFQGQGWGAFSDLGLLTAFADYKLPQVLRHLGILKYAPELAQRIDSKTLLEPGSPQEVEIRATTIWAVESMRECLADMGAVLSERSVGLRCFHSESLPKGTRWRSLELDWLLWQQGQSLAAPQGLLPHHRVRTIFY